MHTYSPSVLVRGFAVGAWQSWSVLGRSPHSGDEPTAGSESPNDNRGVTQWRDAMAGEPATALPDGFHKQNRYPSGGFDRLSGLEPAPLTARYRRGQSIRTRGNAGECWGRTVRGAARLCAAQCVDQRRIIDFLLPGDFLEPSGCGQGLALEAARDDTVMAFYQTRSVERLADSDPCFGRGLRELSLATASRFRRQILILGRGPAMGKVSAFLLDMEKRLTGNLPGRILLPMSRYDIADYLAISVETVSRSLTSLRDRKAIMLIRRRELTILDHAALEDGYLHV
jgi:CRP/FNR family nitrogen fixation transcriptional regulator